MALQLDGNGSDGPQNKSPVPRNLLGMILRVMVIMVMIVVIMMMIVVIIYFK
jgi:cell division protein FtsL